MICSYSKAQRKQILAVDMAYALILIYKELVKDPKTEVIQIIDAAHLEIKIIQKKLWGDGNLILKNNNLTKYHGTLKTIQSEIDSIIGIENNMCLDFISGILAIVATQTDTISAVSKNQNYINSWQNLLQNLQSLYEYYDPELECENVNNNGSLIANRINSIIEQS